MKKIVMLSMAVIVYLLFFKPSFADESNPNLWSVYRDMETGFRISYPPSWIIPTAKGNNVKFTVSPKIGAGNCNVVVAPNKELLGISQVRLNREIESLDNNQSDWAGFIGLPVSKIHLIESHKAKIFDIPALFATVETTLNNLKGEYSRKQIVALTFTPGFVWSINCGASIDNYNAAKARFDELKPIFYDVLGSFVFIKKTE
jgi:hypothetical protein